MIITRKRVINFILIFVIVCGALGATTQKAKAATTDLFISEYIEGSSYNKAIEIYNGTGAPVDLSQYSVVRYSNGATSPTDTLSLSTTLADGDVYVIAYSASVQAILDEADITNAVVNYNGNDAMALMKGTSFIDVIGKIGEDPGDYWGSEPITTEEHTLVRKSTICAGDTDGTDDFDPADEWDSYAQDTFTYLGAHTAVCEISTDPLINEFSIDTIGFGDIEYVEFFGPAETDFSAYTLLEIEGDSGTMSGTIDEIITLGTSDTNGFLLYEYDNGTLENGSVSLLLVKNFTGSMYDDIDEADDGVIDHTFWDELIDSVAIDRGDSGDLVYGDTVLTVGYDGLSGDLGGASRIPDGYDTDAAGDWVRNDFDLAGIDGYTGTISEGEAYNTPGEPNQMYEPPAEACGDAYTAIYEIQGNGASTPLSGTEVATEGIVIGDYQVGGKNGFFIQDATGDGDPTTSDGVYVYAPSGIDVAVGDHVRVRGTATEYSGLTEIGSVSQIWICETGQALPAATAVSLPMASTDAFEPFEGMRVTFPQDLIISEYFNFDYYGSITLTSTRHVTPTALYEPGSAEYSAAVAAYALDSLILDDGRTSYNPDPALHPNGAIFNMDNLFRGGGTVSDLVGVMDYVYGAYTIQPTDGGTYNDTNTRTTSADLEDGELVIASLNVLNYFTTLDDSGPICGPSGNQDCRGADTAEELYRQRAKILAALIAMDADVVGLIEIENHPLDAAVADLVNGLNAIVGVGTYTYVATGPIGTDAIKVAMIYKPASVTPIGNYAILDSSVDPSFIDSKNRPALAVSFEHIASGEGFTVVVNHLKSKSSDCDALGDPDLGDGAGNCNITRTMAAAAEVDWLETDPTSAGVDNIILIGDFNAYDKEDPIDAILAGPDDVLGTSDDYHDMLFEKLGDDAYGYVYDGMVGYLDYALVNASFFKRVTDVTLWHINADEPDIIDYDMTYKQDAQDALFVEDQYRSSDHDPVMVSFNFFDLIFPLFFH